jgi:hypothetical protein
MSGDLPGFLADVAELVGRAAALQVAKAKGGQEKVWIPRPGYLTPDHWLVETVGLEAAKKIAELYQGERVDIPLGPFAGVRANTHKALRQAIADGTGSGKAAQLAGVHQRTARRHVARSRHAAPKKTTPQGELPLTDRRPHR